MFYKPKYNQILHFNKNIHIKIKNMLTIHEPTYSWITILSLNYSSHILTMSEIDFLNETYCLRWIATLSTF